jgi:adenylate cyclase
MRAALDMQAVIRTLNQDRMASGRRPIEVGIGINTGTAIVGFMGSSERHEFTAIGDPVNVAARLCGMARGGEVLAAGNTIDLAGEGFQVEPLPLSQVKGKEKGVRTYRVLDPGQG